MSDIVFNCSKCGARLSAGPEEVGDEFECPVCGTTQVVPGQPEPEEPEELRPATEPAGPRPSTRVVRLPKKKIVLTPPKVQEEEEDDIEEVIEEETGGSGLRVFAMAIGTAGFVLCVMSVTWILLAQRLPDNGDREWWQLILTFVSIFLLSLMGIVLAGVAFRVERIAARLELLESAD
ncbi:MAG: hypothetical protein JXB04_09245 [Kiritimatiellae bacterium]|nr:hypothetical protein [Kiritimatiellia bacterium]